MDALLKRHFWVVNLAVIGVSAIFAGKAVAHFVEGAYLAGDDTRSSLRHVAAAPTKAHGKDTDEIIRRDLFCSACVPEPIKSGGTTDPGDPNRIDKTGLQLELVSTMVCPSDDTWSMAVIRDLSTKEKDSAMFNRGSMLFGTNAVVVKVLPRRIYLHRDNHYEYLDLDGAAPVPPPKTAEKPVVDPATGDIDKGVTCNGNNCSVDRKLVDSLLSNTAALATGARFVPSIKDGKANGFKVYAIRPSSIFAKIGLQNGDTVKSINGMDMASPDKALEVYTKLRNASRLAVSVERRGENITLDYTIR